MRNFFYFTVAAVVFDSHIFSGLRNTGEQISGMNDHPRGRKALHHMIGRYPNDLAEINSAARRLNRSRCFANQIADLLLDL
jgi:hypothetical protein